VCTVKEEYGFNIINGQPDFYPRQERKQLDDVVFDALRLTKGERDAIYEAIINLVEARINKAGSI